MAYTTSLVFIIIVHDNQSSASNGFDNSAPTVRPRTRKKTNKDAARP